MKTKKVNALLHVMVAINVALLAFLYLAITVAIQRGDTAGALTMLIMLPFFSIVFGLATSKMAIAEKFGCEKWGAGLSTFVTVIGISLIWTASRIAVDVLPGLAGTSNHVRSAVAFIVVCIGIVYGGAFVCISLKRFLSRISISLSRAYSSNE